jgi:hypothetical protein
MSSNWWFKSRRRSKSGCTVRMVAEHKRNCLTRRAKSRRGIRRTPKWNFLGGAPFGREDLLEPLSCTPRGTLDVFGRGKLVFVTPIEDGTARGPFRATFKRPIGPNRGTHELPKHVSGVRIWKYFPQKHSEIAFTRRSA